MKSRNLAGYAVAAFLLYFAITNPTQAAEILRTIGFGVSDFASALTGGSGR